MVIPNNVQAYTQGGGTSIILTYVREPFDPNSYNINYPLYQGWVNTVTKGMWYLQSFVPVNGVITAQWRAVAPIVIMTRDPISSDYQYPLGQTWVNTSSENYWVLVNVAGTSGTWIELSGGGVSPLRLVEVDASTPPGTDPVIPTAGGLITVTGGQVAAGTTANAIQTNSLSANEYTVQIQRSQAVASSTIGDNGIAHFNSADFTVDGNGFVSALSSSFTREVGVDAHTSPGTDPVLPTGAGLITVTGGQVAAGTTANVIRTDSLAANTYTVQVQRSQAVASSTVGDNGVSHFNSANFSVDANGFVTLIGGSGFTSVNQQVFTTSGTYTPTSGMEYALVVVVGDGGGGGGAASVGMGQGAGGGGGGGGGFSEIVVSAGTVGASQVVTVGTGGAGGSIGSGGSSGSGSSFGSIASASGGTGGGVTGPDTYVTGPIGGVGGVGSGGSINGYGGCGGIGVCGPQYAAGGSGGDSRYGGGAPGTNNLSGSTGNVYGGGGSGGGSTLGSSGTTGGAGAPGIVIVTEYIG